MQRNTIPNIYLIPFILFSLLNINSCHLHCSLTRSFLVIYEKSRLNSAKELLVGYMHNFVVAHLAPSPFFRQKLKLKIRTVAINEQRYSLGISIKLKLEMRSFIRQAPNFKFMNFKWTYLTNLSDCGEDSTVLFYNNIGVAHYAMGKPNLACHYFQTALKEDLAKTQTKESNEKPLFKIGGSKYHEIVYNLGLALLQAGKPVQAFECLIVAVRRFHRNSRLWLRLAECCIMTHKQVIKINSWKQRCVGNFIKFVFAEQRGWLWLAKEAEGDRCSVAGREGDAKSRSNDQCGQGQEVQVFTSIQDTVCSFFFLN